MRRIAIACAAAAGLANAAAADPCAPWPGEPSPLPRVDAADEMLQRWARLRVRELESAARALEATAPMRAHRLWRRVLCLDAANDAAAAGIARTPLVAVHEPVLVTRRTPDEVGDAWAGLSRPLEVHFPRPSPPEPAPQPTADFAARLAELEQRVKSARFEEALSDAVEVRRAAPGPGERARVEVLAATAALALGRREEADVHLGLALAEQPDLALDPATTPPKVRRALDRVRAEQGR